MEPGRSTPHQMPSFVEPVEEGEGELPPASGALLVPSYPYNTDLAAQLTSTSRGGPTTDDSDLLNTNLPSVQVDYLSHEWNEEDIWSSWRATTRQKASMVNGIRLENSIWRQWIKKRFGLKTISPEHLNWLKDSDVTWLYGPLHTGNTDLTVYVEKEAKAEDRLGLDFQVASRPRPMADVQVSARAIGSRPPKVTHKPILKHRSLSDILTVPHFKDQRRNSYDAGEGDSLPPTRPGSSLTIDLPPPSTHNYLKPLADDELPSSDTPNECSDSGRPGSKKRRKHIAFSNRVEQCIAVDSDSDREKYTATSAIFGARLQRTNSRSQSYFGRSSSSESDDSQSDDDLSDVEDEEVLTFRSKRQHSTSWGQTQSPWQQQQAVSQEAPEAGKASEPHTIAKLAPTILKNSEVLPSPSPVVVFSPKFKNISLPPDSDDEDFIDPLSPPDASNGFAATYRVTSTPQYATNYSYAPTATVINSSASLYAGSDELPRGYYAGQAQKVSIRRPVLQPPPDPAKFQRGEHSPVFSPPPSSIPELFPSRSEPVYPDATPERASPIKGYPFSYQTDGEEERSRGRPVHRTASTSSLEARSQSRGASITSSNGSLSPVAEPHRYLVRRSSNLKVDSTPDDDDDDGDD